MAEAQRPGHAEGPIVAGGGALFEQLPECSKRAHGAAPTDPCRARKGLALGLNALEAGAGRLPSPAALTPRVDVLVRHVKIGRFSQT